MRIRTPRTAVAGLGFLIAVSAGTVAYADTSLDWFEGDNATVADPHQLSAPLKIYDAAGAVVTSGDIDEPFGAFVAADGAIAAGATHASLFVHVPSPSSAPGAWTGLQATGTTKLDVTHPPALNGKAFAVSSSSRAITLEQIVQGYENTSTADSFADVYELRLRTSSATGGVSDDYASTFVKVDGTTWSVTGAPDLGETTAPDATVTPAWGGAITYGTARAVIVTVSGGSTPAKGKVVLKSGTTVVSQAERVLDSSGRATLTIPKGKLLPGKRAVTVAFTTSDAAIAASGVSAAHTYAVSKGAVAAPTFKVTKKITAKKAGSLTVRLATPSGLARPTGKVDVILKKGRKTVTIRNKTVAANGQVKVKVPKQKAGKWTVTISYKGDARYNAKKSAAKKITVAKK